MLAETGRHSTNQALQRANVDRPHPILLATLAETYFEALDELVQLLDLALAAQTRFWTKRSTSSQTPLCPTTRSGG
jgi:hypothetical protein